MRAVKTLEMWDSSTYPKNSDISFKVKSVYRMKLMVFPIRISFNRSKKERPVVFAK